MEPETLGLFCVQASPVGERRLEHREGADDVRLDEGCGTVDRTIHMALRREMHDGVRFEVGERAVDGLAVADVGAHERIVRAGRDRRKRIQDSPHRLVCRGRKCDRRRLHS